MVVHLTNVMPTWPLLLLLLTTSDRTAVLDRIGELVRERYVYEDVARRCTAQLQERNARGEFAALEDAPFAAAVTAALRADCDDKHFELVVSQPSAPAPADPSSWLEPLRRRNYDFAEVRHMPGNVGYVEIRSFPPPDVAATVAAGAMNMLAGTDAIIIDLRRNGGGTGDMVLFLATYFFERQTALGNTIRRAQGTSTQDRTLPYVPGPRLTKQELFILTGKETFSAAEAFAFLLQQVKRATIVGAVTKGGANAGRFTDVPPNFRVFISNAHATSAATGKTWDKVGITPDIAVPEAEALTAAHREALRRLRAKTTDAAWQRELDALLD
ncbi:MAG TPA: S41 family peptidase [Thermoanaerobaculia bacterium]|nr:S41 family peptidase [Thermoanaerobaculia bacterium]